MQLSDGALSVGPFSASVSFTLDLVVLPPTPPAPGPAVEPPPPPPASTPPAPSASEPQAPEAAAGPQPGSAPGQAPANFNDLTEIAVRLAKVEARVLPKVVTPPPEATLNEYTPGPAVDMRVELLRVQPAQIAFNPSVPNDWEVAPAFAEGPTEQAREEIQVLIDSVKFGGMALSVGMVWWASRISAMLGSLLASTPAWRHIDPLPVLGRDEEDEKEWYEHDDREADANELAIASVLDGGRAWRSRAPGLAKTTACLISIPPPIDDRMGA